MPRVTWVRRYDMADPVERATGLDVAGSAVRRGDLVVLPTDTVYGLGTDAFSPDAVTKLLETKGRGRDMPVPVLVPADGLEVRGVARRRSAARRVRDARMRAAPSSGSTARTSSAAGVPIGSVTMFRQSCMP